MKLEHYNKSVPAPEYSELDFLKAENAFLQDELKLQEMEHSLELQQEGRLHRQGQRAHHERALARSRERSHHGLPGTDSRAPLRGQRCHAASEAPA